MAMDVAWPPTTDMRSMMVTLYFSGCWARVAAHDWRSCQSVADVALELWKTITIPAAPPPTMTMFFFWPFLSNPSEDMIRRRTVTVAAQCSACDEGLIGGRWRAAL